MTKEKEFIFPMNYKKKEKFLGFIDYKCLVVIALIGFLVILLLKQFDFSISVKVTVFIVVVGFFSVLILVGVNGENMLSFIYFMVKYLAREKVYVYRKTEDKKGGMYAKVY